ncbi:alpha-galactosidase [Flavivirga spongiicola]|uniref:Alpha-galactosidase n=1 Tax=Flavivirga spongiicola TaxID=421621 RepID=A0ABU7XNN7_9FLAO|nr:alpha-galactosidase [Flavivirga sp. MEBiC05379]MDO5977382.1 alpha-galactosidase [Flavivirga sp. MEBiC05379]
MPLVIALVSCQKKSEFIIENEFLSRTMSLENGKLYTKCIYNKIADKKLIPENKKEFKLRISKGTHKEGTSVELTSNDFKYVKVTKDESHIKGFLLENKEYQLQVEVTYELKNTAFYIHKFLEIKSENTITLERVDVEELEVQDAFQPYKLKQITTQSLNKIQTKPGYAPERAENTTDYKPGLGQPLYTKQSATFWGIEFPAATNFVKSNVLNCGYLWGKEIKAGETYLTYKAVVGVADDYQYIDDAFYKYIDDIRIRPLRLQVQYNSWFDFYQGVTREKFQKSAKKIYQELVIERKTKAINAYVIDDGWQDSFSDDADWSDKLWKVNTDRFDGDFKSSYELVKSQGGKLGLWYSPGCFFGANKMVKKLGEQGFESLDFSMSMAGPKYMDAFEERTLELANQGISYFKFDGVFGHLYTRAFEINGRGTPKMPQLETKGFTSTDTRLNDSKYDELKTYYLVAGTERLIDIFTKVSKINPEVFMAITNGAYLSPWWLQHVDLVWLINADDGAIGEGRSGELVYRDGVYHDIWVKENTKFPMNAIFNHEPKKVKTGESKEQFSEYLFMNLSRGTGFIEFYIKTENLSEQDWDVMAKGLKWVYDVFPTFQNVKMHGGDPRSGDVYGYCGFNNEGGYASFHNPSQTETQTYTFTLNRSMGCMTSLNRLGMSSPLENASEFGNAETGYEKTIKIILKPKEVKVLNFDRVK